MWEWYAVLCGVMLAAGMLGGAVNYMFGLRDAAGSEAPGDLPPFTRDPRFYQSLLVGIAASFVVPVFLQIAAVGSDANVLTVFLENADSRTDAGKAVSSLAVIVGFCILAAVSSRTFLQTLSEKLLRQVESKADRAAEQVSDVQEDLERTKAEASGTSRMARSLDDTIEELMRLRAGGTVAAFADAAPPASDDTDDPDDDSGDAGAEEAPEPMAPPPPQAVPQPGPAPASVRQSGDDDLNDLDIRILQGLASKPTVRRSIKGIREEMDIPRSAPIRQRLERMASLGYIRKLEPLAKDSKLPRWKLDAKGWAKLP